MVLGAVVVAIYAAAVGAADGSVEHLQGRSGRDWPLVALAAADVALQVLVARLGLPGRRAVLATGLGALGSATTRTTAAADAITPVGVVAAHPGRPVAAAKGPRE